VRRVEREPAVLRVDLVTAGWQEVCRGARRCCQ